MQHGVLAPPSRQNILFSTGSVRMGQNDPSLESSPPIPRTQKQGRAYTGHGLPLCPDSELPAGHQTQHLAGFLPLRCLDAGLLQ